ncbi:MAG: hypothetical protein KIS61_33650 [Candidatus Eremiobacteraeota bacterium]|nr:hypothetical protein [Candidatus Eremiobacteraeota bacterium]
MAYNIGEKPGKGTYRCNNGHTVTLNDDTDALPPCAKCGAGQNTTYTRA